MSILEREHRVLANPKTFYVTPHYQGYPSVLARVDLMSDSALRELLESGHEFMVAEAKRLKKKR